MKKSMRGFTLIEVAIFLAITGILFVAVTVGVQNSIYQQRINDSTQNFAEFLRTAYSEVSNVQNTGGGRSEKAIYGKLITFGESYDLANNKLEEGSNAIFVYTVIGNVSDSRSGGALSLLHDLGANVMKKTPATAGSEASVEMAGIVERYTPKWAATIEPSCGDKDVKNCDFSPLKGMLLIVKHPNSGTVNTYFSSSLAEVNSIFYDAKRNGKLDANPFEVRNGGNYLTNGGFKMEQVDFCINGTGEQNVTNRMDVRIIEGARNASGVEIVPSNDEDYKCGK